MKFFFAVAALAGLSSAHRSVSHFHVNGKADSSCVRRAVSTNPVIDLSSDDMACNNCKNVKAKCAVKAGDEVGFEWDTDPGIPAKNYPLKSGQRVGVTDASHMGPCSVYAKKVSDATTAKAPGGGWFKIAYDGLDCTTKLRKANALQTVKIPSSLEPGDYLLRAEFLILNDAGPREIGGNEKPQFYPSCVQVTITGTTGTGRPKTVSIPGYVNIDTPGLIYDVWNSKTFKNYPMPGPKVFVDVTSPAYPTSSAKVPVFTASYPTEVPTLRPIETSDSEYTSTKAPVFTASYPTEVPTLRPIKTDYINATVTKHPIPIFTEVTDLPYIPAIPSTVITEDLSYTHSGYYPTWDVTGSSWIYPSATTAPTDDTTVTKHPVPIFAEITDLPYIPAIPSTVITEDLSYTHSGYYPTWDVTGSSWIYPSATVAPTDYPTVTDTATPAPTEYPTTLVTTTRKPSYTTKKPAPTSYRPTRPTKKPHCNKWCRYVQRMRTIRKNKNKKAGTPKYHKGY